MMIKKITNWVFGSFFRTMGRFFFFLFFGFLLATILSRSNIQWTDLLGIEMVKASTSFVKPTQDLSINGVQLPSYNNFKIFDVNTTNVSDDSRIIFTSQTNSVIPQLYEGGKWISPYQVQFQVKINYTSIWPFEDNDITSSTTSGSGYYQGWTYDNGLSFNFIPVWEKVSSSATHVGLCSTNSSNNDGYVHYYTVTCNIPYDSYGLNQLIMQYAYNRTNNGSYPTSIEMGISTNFNYIYSDSFDITASQNQNTQQIIHAQENATQQAIESQMVCEYIDKNKGIVNGYLNNQGNVVNNSTTTTTDYLKLTSNDKLRIISSATDVYFCFYNINKTKISCSTTNNYSDYSYVTIPNNTSYIRMSISKTYNKPTYEICQNGNQAMNNFLNDDSTSEANTTASNFFSNFTSQDNGGISSIITAPLSAISGLVSATCQQIVLPIPYLDNKQLVLPCMSAIYTEHFGAFFSIYQTIIFGAIAYRMLVSIFMMIQGFKNPDDDKIEVVDL